MNDNLSRAIDRLTTSIDSLIVYHTDHRDHDKDSKWWQELKTAIDDNLYDFIVALKADLLSEYYLNPRP